MSAYRDLPRDVESVLTYWFVELHPNQHFVKDAELDKDIATQFGILHQRAALAELASWRETPHGRLAEVIVLDQFSRNIYRESSLSFAYDGMALCLAQVAIAGGHDQLLTLGERAFLYMPYMHSESAQIQSEGLQLFNQAGMEDNYRFAKLHQDIIERFGRFPHRNQLLGRQSTAEELAFLQQPGSGF